MTATEWKTVMFRAERGIEWDLTLPRPLAEGRPVVSFNDSLGYNCGVEAFISTTDSRVLTVRSRSGLAMTGTISVVYQAAMRSVLGRERPSFCVTHEVRSA